MAAACSPLSLFNTLGPRDRGAAKVASGLRYGDDPRQVMDVTLPAGPGPHPVLMLIHGGAFKMGDKAMSAVSEQVLAAGIAVVRINYRLTGTDLWPAQLDDCLAAVAFLRAKGGDFGLDPARMALWGQSAGGFLAVSTALSLVQAGTPPQAVIDLPVRVPLGFHGNWIAAT